MATTMTATMAATASPQIAAPRYFASPDVRYYTEEAGTALFNTRIGRFDSLVKEGSLVWQMLATSSQETTVEAVADELLALGKFVDAPRAQTERALERMFAKLITLGLIKRSDQASIYTDRSDSEIRSSFGYVLALITRPTVSLLSRYGQLTLAVCLYLLMSDLILKVVGFGKLYESIKHWPVARRPWLDMADIVDLCEAIDHARLWYPKETLCLPFSAVTTCLLRSSGVAAEMVIGAQKEPFKGHAWTEVEGVVVNDKQKVQVNYHVMDRI
jgi:hypothetical protein